MKYIKYLAAAVAIVAIFWAVYYFWPKKSEEEKQIKTATPPINPGNQLLVNSGQGKQILSDYVNAVIASGQFDDQVVSLFPIKKEKCGKNGIFFLPIYPPVLSLSCIDQIKGEVSYMQPIKTGQGDALLWDNVLRVIEAAKRLENCFPLFADFNLNDTNSFVDKYVVPYGSATTYANNKKRNAALRGNGGAFQFVDSFRNYLQYLSSVYQDRYNELNKIALFDLKSKGFNYV